MGEGCTRNRPPPPTRVNLHVDEWRHTMEWHGGQTSHRRQRREGFWPLREAEKRPSQLRPRRGPPSQSYCNSSRRLEACGSSSRLDVPLHPQPVTKLHPDKSRKHLPLQKTANHNWVVAILDGTPIVTSGPRRQHWPLQTI